MEKFIDTQMKPIKVPGNVAADKAPDSQPAKLVKQYLVKWKSRSYLHCSWCVTLIMHIVKVVLTLRIEYEN